MPGLYGWLADAVVVLHLAFIVFVTAGGLGELFDLVFEALHNQALFVEVLVVGDRLSAGRVGGSLGNVALPAGSRIMLRFAAANRDPAQYPQPDALDVGRVKAYAK